jgi:hypothetical protein
MLSGADRQRPTLSFTFCAHETDDVMAPTLWKASL